MSSSYVLMAFGQDGPGVVSGVAGFLYTLGANIEDASMTRLGGEFAVMLVVQIPKSVTEAALGRQVRAFEKKSGLRIQIKPISIPSGRSRPQKAPQALLSVYGTDKPGIVFHVTQALAKRRINITDLNTRVLRRSKDPVYVMLLEVQLSRPALLKHLQDDMNRLHERLGVEITVQELETIAL